MTTKWNNNNSERKKKLHKQQTLKTETSKRKRITYLFMMNKTKYRM